MNHEQANRVLVQAMLRIANTEIPAVSEEMHLQMMQMKAIANNALLHIQLEPPRGRHE